MTRTLALQRTAAVRRSPVAVVWDPGRDDEPIRWAAEGILGGLVSVEALDVGGWTFGRAAAWPRPLVRREIPARLGLTDVRWVRWEAPSLSPRLLSTLIGAHLIAGPSAARPRALIALGLGGAGSIAGALGRIFDVPVAVAILPGELAEGWTPRALRAARGAEQLLTVDEDSADQAARRGFAALRSFGVGTRGAWRELGDRVAESLGQGTETSTSRS